MQFRVLTHQLAERRVERDDTRRREESIRLVIGTSVSERQRAVERNDGRRRESTQQRDACELRKGAVECAQTRAAARHEDDGAANQRTEHNNNNNKTTIIKQ